MLLLARRSTAWILRNIVDDTSGGEGKAKRLVFLFPRVPFLFGRAPRLWGEMAANLLARMRRPPAFREKHLLDYSASASQPLADPGLAYCSSPLRPLVFGRVRRPKRRRFASFGSCALGAKRLRRAAPTIGFVTPQGAGSFTSGRYATLCKSAVTSADRQPARR